MSIPKTFSDLGMKFTQDDECSVCQTGECHNRAIGKIDDVDYFIEVIVQQEYCSNNCNNPIFKIDVTSDASTFAGNELNREFDNEEDAIKYLFDTFEDFKCSKY